MSLFFVFIDPLFILCRWTEADRLNDGRNEKSEKRIIRDAPIAGYCTVAPTKIIR